MDGTDKQQNPNKMASLLCNSNNPVFQHGKRSVRVLQGTGDVEI
jgi:hypothetical protein